YAAQADARIAESLEQIQCQSLQTCRDAATADRGQAFQCALTDAAAAVRAQRGIERHRLPVHQFQSVDRAIELARDRAEIEHAGDLAEIELAQIDVGAQHRRDTERLLHRQA